MVSLRLTISFKEAVIYSPWSVFPLLLASVANGNKKPFAGTQTAAQKKNQGGFIYINSALFTLHLESSFNFSK